MSETELKDHVVVYHANCRDGFSSAYAAWKKFGDEATYLPRKVQAPPPDGLFDKHVYIVDYSYDKETLEGLRSVNRSVIVLDHHQTAQEAVTAFPENVFDLEHSGAVLSWTHFHPDKKVPRFLEYIEDHDLWKWNLPHTREISALIGLYDFNFETWDKLAAQFDNEGTFQKLVERSRMLYEGKRRYIKELLGYAEKVKFEDYEVYAVNCARPYRAEVGNQLAKRHPPFGIVWYHYDGMFHVSLRSRGDFDVAKLAEKYGGGGHKNAASVRFKTWSEVPFEYIEQGS